jgi:hypothetical protein
VQPAKHCTEAGDELLEELQCCEHMTMGLGHSLLLLKPVYDMSHLVCHTPARDQSNMVCTGPANFPATLHIRVHQLHDRTHSSLLHSR